MKVSKTQLADLCGVTRPAIDLWVSEGMPVAEGDGKRGSSFDSGAVVDWLRNRERIKGGDRDLTVERARLTSAQADSEELKLGELRSELVRVAEAGRAWDDCVLRIRSRILALPGRAAQFVGLTSPVQAQRLLKDAVHEILVELSDNATK